MELPLCGVRIADCSAVISGPLAITILADQGTDVIKVEPPGAGDVLRAVGSSRGGMSGLFHVANRGKALVALNLAHEAGRGILRGGRRLRAELPAGRRRAHGHRLRGASPGAARFSAEDVPCGVVRELSELHNDPQVVTNRTFVEREQPMNEIPPSRRPRSRAAMARSSFICGRLRELGPAARFGAVPLEPAGPAPGLGEHSDAILREIGAAGRIAELRAHGIVA